MNNVVELGFRNPPLRGENELPVGMNTNNAASKVLIINTGGAVCMALNMFNSLECTPGYLAQCLSVMSELRMHTMPQIDVLEYYPLSDSSDFFPSDWERLAQDIFKHYDSYDGFLVIHGTDTMHYTAAALSFALLELSKPVVLTGGMVPLGEVYSDSARNLIHGLAICADPTVCEVCIFFNEKLLRGNCTMNTRLSVSAYESPHIGALGRTTQGAAETAIALRRDLLWNQPKKPLRKPTVVFERSVFCVVGV